MTRTRTRTEINAAHRRLVQEGLLAVSKAFKTGVYVDALTQWEGESKDGYHVKAGMTWGTFDIFICARGQVIWADAKTGNAKLSTAQQDFQRWIRAAGGTAEIFRSPNELVEIVRNVVESG